MNGTLFPYPFPVLQIDVQDAWIVHANAHAEARRVKKGTRSRSGWDVSARLGEIAFATMARNLGGLAGTVQMKPGDWQPPFLLADGMKVQVVTVEASKKKERCNIGTKASLRVSTNRPLEATAYVLALYDAPWIDFVGWALAAQVESAPVMYRKKVLPCSQLRPIQTLMTHMQKIGSTSLALPG